MSTGKNGRWARTRGHGAEREIARILREAGYEDARRGAQFAGGPDSPDVIGIPGFHIEVKRTEKFAIRPAVSQATRDAKGKPWIIMHRWNFGGWLAVVTLPLLLRLLRTLWDVKRLEKRVEELEKTVVEYRQGRINP